MNVFEVVAKIALDAKDYYNELTNASSKTNSVASSIGKGVSTMAKATGVALGAAGAGVAKLTKSAVESYSEFEQLKGGIETLYGKDAQKMLENAEAAFKDAGLSANEYMDTAIQSSAAMISSLDGDTKEAAKLTNMAIIDMSDNVNKMGTSMEGVQNAYKGFSRGNFTMLDNLALGFAGTKEGMQQLLDKAEEVEKKNGRVVKYSIDSYADIVKAIHVVQDEMKISGTTQEEAAKTISGSIGMMKKSWQNLTTAIANSDWDLDKKADDFVNSLETVFDNVMPVVEKALESVGKIIEKLAPIIADKLPGIINKLLPPLLSSAATIVQKLAENLPTLLTTLVDVVSQNLPMLINTLTPAVVEGLVILISAVVDEAPRIFSALVQAIDDLADQIGDKLAEKFPALSLVFENLETIVWVCIDAFIAFKAAMMITSVITSVKKALTALKKVTELQTIAQKALNFVTNMSPWAWVATAIGLVVTALVTLWMTSEDFREAVKKFFKSVGEWFSNLWSTISGFWNEVINVFEEKIEAIVNFFKGMFEAVTGFWNELIGVFEDWIAAIVSGVKGLVDKIVGFFRAAGEVIKTIWNAIKDFFSLIWEGIKGVFSAVAEFFGNIFQAAVDAIKLVWDSITGFFQGVWDGISAIFAPVAEFFKGVFEDAAGFIKDVFDQIIGFAQAAKDAIEAIFASISITDDLQNKVNNLQNGGGGGKKKKGTTTVRAVGGVIRRGELAILEGTGAEAVVPLDQNRKWVRAVANEFALAGGGGMGGGDIVIPVYVGNERLDTLVVKANQTNNYRSGGRG